ncbi:hypothetical protein WA026_000725 [Henosepilachna vigintioctopunctata]|uniref:Uncharacterized protein n=1 Tax=Henosepilachna vigintioctopunctata TaxID=420089 RepID=A0AAW1V5U3_9CUCU
MFTSIRAIRTHTRTSFLWAIDILASCGPFSKIHPSKFGMTTSLMIFHKIQHKTAGPERSSFPSKGRLLARSLVSLGLDAASDPNVPSPPRCPNAVPLAPKPTCAHPPPA